MSFVVVYAGNSERGKGNVVHLVWVGMLTRNGTPLGFKWRFGPWKDGEVIWKLVEAYSGAKAAASKTRGSVSSRSVSFLIKPLGNPRGPKWDAGTDRFEILLETDQTFKVVVGMDWMDLVRNLLTVCCRVASPRQGPPVPAPVPLTCSVSAIAAATSKPNRHHQTNRQPATSNSWT
jgi:hypothetical protein